MENDVLNGSTEPTNDNIESNGQYIEAIEKLKRETVSKDKYEKLKSENQQLLDTLINGGQATNVVQSPVVNIDELRKELFDINGQLDNLTYATKALELRKALMDKGELDPFLPQGCNIAPTPSDVAAADKLAQALQSCIEYADGDSAVFTNELMRITNDAMPQAAKRGRR